MSTQPIDYAALAQQARQSAPPVDYAALAAMARASRVPGMEKLGGVPPGAGNLPVVDDLQGPPDPPSPGFFRSAYNMLPHPIDAAKEWIDSPDRLRQASDAAQQERLGNAPPGNPELGILSSPDDPGGLINMTARPAAVAGSQVAEGNFSGAAGSLVGGYGPAVLAPKLPVVARKTASLGADAAVAVGRGAVAAAPEVVGGAAMIGGAKALGHVPGLAAVAYPAGRMLYSGLKKGAEVAADTFTARRAVARAKAIREEAAAQGSRNPAWQDLELTAPDIPEATPIPGNLPSGRVPGTGQSSFPSPGQPAPPRPAPAWQDIELSAPDIPETKSIPGSLRSGRKVGGIQNQQATPQAAPELTIPEAPPAPVVKPKDIAKNLGGKQNDPVVQSVVDRINNPTPEDIALNQKAAAPPASSTVTIPASNDLSGVLAHSVNRSNIVNDAVRVMNNSGYGSDMVPAMGPEHWDAISREVDKLRGAQKGSPQRARISDQATIDAIQRRLQTQEQLRDSMNPGIGALRPTPAASPTVDAQGNPVLTSPETQQ